jgi:ATP-dependent DNA helicase RecG
MYSIFFQPVNTIIPMKETAEKALKRLGIYLLRDLIFYKPISYNIINVTSDFKKFQNGILVQVDINIDEIVKSTSRRSPTKIYTSNDTGTLTLVFFNKIPPFIYTRLKEGAKYTVSGKVQFFDGTWQITHPEFLFKKELSAPVEPVYPLSYGLINKQLYGYILSGINAVETAIKARISFGKISDNEKLYIESLLGEVKRLHLIGLTPDPTLIEKSIEEVIGLLSARELFANQVSLAKLKSKEKAVLGRKFSISQSLKQQTLDRLGFELTNAQKQSISEIEDDQVSDIQMMKLLQGDVGSGKTLVALLTIINVASSGSQSALMVPTDLLSMQHFQFFKHALEGTNITPALLTGKISAADRKKIKAGLETGEIDILIGTHALFQSTVEFKDLGFVVIDEQHRFGVEQRLELIAKASRPDVLVMTATPIPRSLTLTMFGDMSIARIETKPKNRLPIITTITSNTKKDEVIQSLHKKLELDEKIYWICPLIDQNDKILAREEDAIYADLTARYAELESVYPGMVAILHGKMKSADKDHVMQQFKAGAIRILIATTVIEVGIDVSDATLIIIENAEKFGLAQLHQLRGRVGRGELQSYCMLMYNPKRLSSMARQRLEIMRKSSDGFYIAEQDLILRGGGEILGTKQSGEPDFFFANLGRDLKILLQANKNALEIEFSEFIEFQTKLFARDREDLAKSG